MSEQWIQMIIGVPLIVTGFGVSLIFLCWLKKKILGDDK